MCIPGTLPCRPRSLQPRGAGSALVWAETGPFCCHPLPSPAPLRPLLLPQPPLSSGRTCVPSRLPGAQLCGDLLYDAAPSSRLQSDRVPRPGPPRCRPLPWSLQPGWQAGAGGEEPGRGAPGCRGQRETHGTQSWPAAGAPAGPDRALQGPGPGCRCGRGVPRAHSRDPQLCPCSADQALAVKTWTLILHLEIIWQLLRNAAPAHVGLVGGCVLTGSPGADASAPAPHARRTWRLLTRLPTCHFPAEEPFRFPSSPKSRAASSKCAPLSGTHLRPPLRALAAPRPHPRVGTPPSRGARVKAASIAVSWPPGRMSPWSCPSRGTDVCGRRSWAWSEAVGVPESLRMPAPALPWSPAAGLPRDTAPAGLRDLARRLLKRD